MMLKGDRPFLFRLNGIKVDEVKPEEGKACNLPQDLVIVPGTYLIFGKTYPMKKEGLYRFLYPPLENKQRIVYRKNVLALLSAIAWMVSHGSRDNGRKHEELLRLALTGKVIITCGDASNFAYNILSSLGIRSRVVGTRTLSELNSYDTGHVLLEVCLDEKWVLVDIDQKVIFTCRNRQLSLLESVAHVQTDDYQLKRIAASVPLAVSDFKKAGYDYGLWMETKINSEKTLRRWYKKIMMVPVISSEGINYTVCPPVQQKKIHRVYPEWNYKIISSDAFQKRFYPPLHRASPPTT